MAETLVGSAGGWSAITAHWERMPSSAAAVRWWMAVACSGTHKIPKLGVTGSRGARVNAGTGFRMLWKPRRNAVFTAP